MGGGGVDGGGFLGGGGGDGGGGFGLMLGGKVQTQRNCSPETGIGSGMRITMGSDMLTLSSWSPSRRTIELTPVASSSSDAAWYGLTKNVVKEVSISAPPSVGVSLLSSLLLLVPPGPVCMRRRLVVWSHVVPTGNKKPPADGPAVGASKGCPSSAQASLLPTRIERSGERTASGCSPLVSVRPITCVSEAVVLRNWFEREIAPLTIAASL